MRVRVVFYFKHSRNGPGLIYWALTECKNISECRIIWFYYRFFCSASFTQYMVTKEVLISHSSDDFEEAMFRLKESGSFEGPFWDMGGREWTLQRTFSVFREEFTVTLAATSVAQLSHKPHLTFIWVTEKMWNCSHFLTNFDLWQNFSAIPRTQSRDRIQFSQVSFSCLDHKSITCSHKIYLLIRSFLATIWSAIRFETKVNIRQIARPSSTVQGHQRRSRN